MITKLPSETKTEWLEALRSGKYKQTQGYLKRRIFRDEWGFCCLGVLCDITDPSQWSERGSTCAARSGREKIIGYQDVPKDAWRALDQPVDPDYSVRHQLAKMNDEGASFAEIATWIEENL